MPVAAITMSLPVVMPAEAYPLALLSPAAPEEADDAEVLGEFLLMVSLPFVNEW